MEATIYTMILCTTSYSQVADLCLVVIRTCDVVKAGTFNMGCFRAPGKSSVVHQMEN